MTRSYSTLVAFAIIATSIIHAHRLDVCCQPMADVNVRKMNRDLIKRSLIDPNVEFIAANFAFGGSSPIHEAAPPHQRFVMLKEVGVRDFSRFLLATKGEIIARKWTSSRTFEFQSDLPVTALSRKEIVAYCNWIGGRLLEEKEYNALIRKFYSEKMDALDRTYFNKDRNLLSLEKAIDFCRTFNFNGMVNAMGRPVHGSPNDLSGIASFDAWSEMAPRGSYRSLTPIGAPLDLLGNAMELVWARDANSTTWTKGQYFYKGGCSASPLTSVVAGRFVFTESARTAGFRVTVNSNRVR